MVEVAKQPPQPKQEIDAAADVIDLVMKDEKSQGQSKVQAQEACGNGIDDSKERDDVSPN